MYNICRCPEPDCRAPFVIGGLGGGEDGVGLRALLGPDLVDRWERLAYKVCVCVCACVSVCVCVCV